MADKQIILYSARFDDHMDIIVDHLAKLGIEPIRLNAEEIPRDIRVSFEHHDNKSSSLIHVLNGDRTIRSSEVQSVFVRKPISYNFPEAWTRQEKLFAQNETEMLFRGVFSSFDCYWINHPVANESAGNKLEQLGRASRYGLRTPKTLASNDPVEVERFYQYCHGNIIFKVFSDPFLAFHERLNDQGAGEGESSEINSILVTRTTPVTKRMMASIGDIIATPGQFQELLDKKVDLRVTVIGNQLFAINIHSQDFEETTFDWRTSSLELRHSVAELPKELENRCFAFIKSYGLSFGAMDFVITKDDEYVFLENNPTAQFLAYDNFLPEPKMAEALCRCLLSGEDV